MIRKCDFPLFKGGLKGFFHLNPNLILLRAIKRIHIYFISLNRDFALGFPIAFPDKNREKLENLYFGLKHTVPDSGSQEDLLAVR